MRNHLSINCLPFVCYWNNYINISLSNYFDSFSEQFLKIQKLRQLRLRLLSPPCTDMLAAISYIRKTTNGTKYSGKDQVNLWKTAFKKLKKISLQIFLKAVFHKFYLVHS